MCVCQCRVGSGWALEGTSSGKGANTAILGAFPILFFRFEFSVCQFSPTARRANYLTLYVFSVPTLDRMFTTTHLSDHVHDHMTSRQHQPQQGWRFALMPPWASRHVGSGSKPTVHRCPQGKVVGSPNAPQTRTIRQQDSNTLLSTYMVAEPVL